MPPMNVNDRLADLVSGLGTARDIGTRGYYSSGYGLSQSELVAAYRDNWIARKAVDIPAFDMTRAGRDWQADKEDIGLIEGLERRLSLSAKQLRALKWARLFGGAILVMGVDQGADASEPLVPNSLGKDSLKYLHVMTRYQINAGPLIREPDSPWYGEPSYYEFQTSAGVWNRIHPSRTVRMVGAEAPPWLGAFVDERWGDSVLQAVDDAIKNATATGQGVANLVKKARLNVVKIPNLTNQVSTAEGAAKQVSRWRMVTDLESMINTTLLDAQETLEVRQVNWAGLPDIQKLQLTIAAAAVDVPATRFLAQSPDGMNATGESDLLNYENRLSSEQELILRPPMERLMDVLIRSALGSRPDGVDWKFAPLRMMTEDQQADIALKKAQATEIYVVSGLVPPAALAKATQNQLLEDDTYPGLGQALEDAEAGRLPEPEAANEDDEADDDVTLPQRVLRQAANDAATSAIRLRRRHLIKIANDLNISERTLRTRLKRLLESLGDED